MAPKLETIRYIYMKIAADLTMWGLLRLAPIKVMYMYSTDHVEVKLSYTRTREARVLQSKLRGGIEHQSKHLLSILMTAVARLK